MVKTLNWVHAFLRVVMERVLSVSTVCDKEWAQTGCKTVNARGAIKGIL